LGPKTKVSITPARIQALESLGFEWGSHGVAGEDRLRELADFCKINGHCNVPKNYSENSKLANWVQNQRYQYKLYLKGKRSLITPARIQALESLGFEWKSSISGRKGTRKKPNLDDDATRDRERAVEAPEHVQTTAQTQEDREICSNQVDVASEPEESYWIGEAHLGYMPGRTEDI
jgi:hypothetical protein